MDKKIIDKRNQIDKEKEKIRLKEKELKEREKKIRAKKFIEIGRLAFRVDIDTLDEDALLGAFIEISEKINDKSINAWKKKSEELRKKQETSERTPLSVCFKSPPNKEIKDRFKELGFRWNSFRKEFFGHGQHSLLSELVKGLDCKIEVVN
jgi:hypothetical protein